MSARLESGLWLAQRTTAFVLAATVTVHLITMIYAIRGGLTAAQILGRTQGNPAWFVFYGLFVVAAAVHAPIGIRTILREWSPLGVRTIDLIALIFAALLLALGLRAVIGVCL